VSSTAESPPSAAVAVTDGAPRGDIGLCAGISGGATLPPVEGGRPTVTRTRTEVHRWRRWLYRGRRSHRVARLLNRAQAALAAHGIGPSRIVVLEVVGRRTGRTVSLPVVVADLDGEGYLVSMLGEDTNWVRNVRAAHGRAVLRHRGRREVVLEEVDPDRRAPVLRRYLDRAQGARAHFPIDRGARLEEFEGIAPRYPVFRITAPSRTASPSEAPPS
jgi:deazaflavin-dependent oxidoreductase (nitroreductase family)